MSVAVDEAVAMTKGLSHLGEFVRRYREAAGITQVALASRSGIGQGQISAMESGRAHVFRPSVSHLESLASGLSHDRRERGRVLRAMLLLAGLSADSVEAVLTFDSAMNREEAAAELVPVLAGVV